MRDRSLTYLCLDDFEVAARRILPRVIYEYVAGGAETDASMRANIASFQDYAFLPRVLVDVKKPEQTTKLFGRTYSSPFGIAPMGGASLAAYEGDLVLARAAAEAGIPMIQSGMSLIRLEDVRAAADTMWFQAYLSADETATRSVLERVQRAGIETLVITVDVPVQSNREYNVRNGYSSPLVLRSKLVLHAALRPGWTCHTLLRTLATSGIPRYHNVGRINAPPLISRARAPHNDDSLGVFSWTNLRRVREWWRGTLVLKGVLHSEDVRLAAEAGVDGVIVSNHGGRQLDGAAAPLRALPDVLKAAGGMAVMIDGGIRRGTDVLKALALGAKFVFIGRPFLHAATAGGKAGVTRAIALLHAEIRRDMALLGVTDLAGLGPGQLTSARNETS